jgi:DNA-binding SARP family transcriptional activator
VEYQVLGHLRVLDENGAEVRLSAPKLRTLLALLLVNQGRPVSVDRIVDTLWGEAPPHSDSNLVQGYIRDLRQRLGAEEVTTVPGGYRLDARRASADAERFEELARARRYEEALALWRGVALEEWVDQPWARATAARLEEMRLSAIEEHLAQKVDTGLASAVLAELAALVDEYPLRERLRVLLIKALYAVGRQADALAAYAQARRYLADEVGLEPGPELRAVEARRPGTGPLPGDRARPLRGGSTGAGYAVGWSRRRSRRAAVSADDGSTRDGVRTGWYR